MWSGLFLLDACLSQPRGRAGARAGLCWGWAGGGEAEARQAGDGCCPGAAAAAAASAPGLLRSQTGELRSPASGTGEPALCTCPGTLCTCPSLQEGSRVTLSLSRACPLLSPGSLSFLVLGPLSLFSDLRLFSQDESSFLAFCPGKKPSSSSFPYQQAAGSLLGINKLWLQFSAQLGQHKSHHKSRAGRGGELHKCRRALLHLGGVSAQTWAGLSTRTRELGDRQVMLASVD